MKGYKVFNPDWTCRGLKYEIGKTYELDGELEICENGFHFCEKLVNCFRYYSFSQKNKVAEIEALGEILTDDDLKFCTNRIKITREISWNEVLNLVNTGVGNTGNSNTGDWNTGRWNTGDRNAGDRNAGDRNTGDRNTGDWNTGNGNAGSWNSGNGNLGNGNTGDRNTGDWNAGDRNTGDWNTGDRNTGDWNAGDWNTGRWNTGDWNAGDFSSGVFNTDEEKIRMFNRPSNWTLNDWRNSKACHVLAKLLVRNLNWIDISEMSELEKAKHSEAETTGGFLKEIEPTSEEKQKWWNGLDETERQAVVSLPNFDAEIFKEITGIDVNGKD